MLRRPPKSTLFPSRRSSDLRTHVTRPSDLPPPDRVQDPWLAVADTNGTSGNWSVSITPLAAPEPRLFTVIVYVRDRKSTRLNSSHGYISYAVFCLKKKKNNYGATFFLNYSFESLRTLVCP